jgi:SAM-dependent methyltransferase
MADWISFWDSEADRTIYVNRRHRDVHFRRVAGDIRALLQGGGHAGTVMDFGCGEALYAEHVAEASERLILCEAAPHVRERLTARFGHDARIEVRAPEELAALPAQSLDTIVMHSVAQYMTRGELDALLTSFRRLLKPDGRLILGDIVPPGVSALTDAGALLGFAAAHGFFAAALVGLVRAVFSNYWRLRQRHGLTRYNDEEMRQKLAAAGFSAQRASGNIGHNPARMTFIGRPA